MQAAIEQFRTNLLRVRNLGSIADAVNSQTTPALDLSDILRAELVFSVSALDHFVHEVVRLGMLESYRGSRPRTNNFLAFQVSLEGVLDGFDAGNGEQWLDDQIRTSNGYRSFQTPANIADAVRLVSDVQLWNEIASRMYMPSQEVRERLQLIVDRRNQIAHEADMNPSPYEDRFSINRMMVTEAVEFIENVAESMHSAIC